MTKIKFRSGYYLDTHTDTSYSIDHTGTYSNILKYYHMSTAHYTTWDTLRDSS